MRVLTIKKEWDIIKMLHKKKRNNQKQESKEGQRNFLCSNKISGRCPFLDFNTNEISEDVALDYLASILVEAFLDYKEHERNKLK